MFRGVSIGAAGTATGEVVFNTAMTGYQEILTDPSYARQIVTLTYPHIGNTGTNPGDLESREVHAAGLVIRDLPNLHSSWRATGSLTEFLVRAGVVAIAGVDTVLQSEATDTMTWPHGGWDELTVPMTFTPQTVTEAASSADYQRIGVGIGLDKQGGSSNQFQFQYDTVRFDSRLEVETTTPLE